MEPPTATSGKKVKLSEFWKHNVETDCWISVRGKVYDVTEWIPKHPGGTDPILLNGVTLQEIPLHLIHCIMDSN